MPAPLAQHIAERLAHAHVPEPAAGVAPLARYVELLTHWNRRINLTSLDVGPATDAAIDRLIVEPLIAAAFVRSSDRAALDIGSGGGSPAIPIAIACPTLRMRMVESRGRKCAFLREVVRELGLDASVEEGRFDDVVQRPGIADGQDLVTARAVRTDSMFWHLAKQITHQGSLLILLSQTSRDAVPSEWVARDRSDDRPISLARGIAAYRRQ